MSLGFIQARTHKGSISTNIPASPAMNILYTIDVNDIVVPTRFDTIWKYVILCLSPIISIGSILYVGFMYEKKNKLILPLLILVSLFIAFFGWLQIMINLGLLTRQNTTFSRISTFLLYICSAICYCASAIAITNQNLFMQFTGSLLASFFVWISFIVIYQGTFLIPNKQQMFSLVQIIILTILWEIRTFLINLHHYIDHP